MREIEFLPDWYPQARRRMRIVRLQVWVVLLLVAGLGMWLVLAARNVRSAQASLATVSAQLVQSELELDQLHKQLELKAQLEVQRQIVTRLGLPVDAARVVRTLDQLMPREMSMRELSLDTEELIRPGTPQTPGVAASTGGTENNKANDHTIDRRLKVRMLAVAPSDVDLANLLSGLTNTPFFENVAYTFSRDKSESGHVMREFEVTFSMNLNQPIVSAE